MKLLKLGLRFWITLTSVVSFVGGWILLAHAPKPDQTNSIYSNLTSAPTLEPLPPLSDFSVNGQNSGGQSWFGSQQQPSYGYRPRFRTGGS